MAVAVAVAVAVAGLTKRFFNHIQKDFLINVWGYRASPLWRVVNGADSFAQEGSPLAGYGVGLRSVH